MPDKNLRTRARDSLKLWTSIWLIFHDFFLFLAAFFAAINQFVEIIIAVYFAFLPLFQGNIIELWVTFLKKDAQKY